MAVWGRADTPVPFPEIAAMPSLPPFDTLVEGSFDKLAALLLSKVPWDLPEVLRTDITGLATMFSVVAMTVNVRCRLRRIAPGLDPGFLPEPAGLCLLRAYQGLGIDWTLPPADPGRLDPFAAAIVKADSFPGHHGPGHRHRPATTADRGDGHLLLDLEAA